MPPTPRQYPALVTKEENSDWNVVFPDLPGCVTAGRSLDEAVTFAEEALALHVHGLREDGEALPAASRIENVMADPESAGGLLYVVPLKPLKAARRSSASPSTSTFAKQIGSNRSTLLAARHALNNRAPGNHPPTPPPAKNRVG